MIYYIYIIIYVYYIMYVIHDILYVQNIVMYHIYICISLPQGEPKNVICIVKQKSRYASSKVT